MNADSCSFCGRNRWQVNVLVGRNSAFICDECCLPLCNEIAGQFLEKAEFMRAITASLEEDGLGEAN